MLLCLLDDSHHVGRGTTVQPCVSFSLGYFFWSLWLSPLTQPSVPPFGPEAVLRLTLFSIDSTSYACKDSGWELEAGRGWDAVVTDC